MQPSAFSIIYRSDFFALFLLFVKRNICEHKYNGKTFIYF
ncbi:hypothetical protein PRUB_a1476 [Pseudoalteromonas rubra]|uniref:Uncharacterized protein n=1 Tax=Pseudoalteromonas rubra TaxID=43658 RepID=A0A8T0C897_9GAMM|nr:hypothetical protein PRUB_a1476 [Pseudoalteromonas rubra]